jgi:hypothetical protein
VAAAPDSDSLNGRRAGTARAAERRPEWAGHRTEDAIALALIDNQPAAATAH